MSPNASERAPDVAPAAAHRSKRVQRRLHILYTGADNGTSLQRADALRELGHDLRFVPSAVPSTDSLAYQVHRVAHRLHRFPDIYRANAALPRIAAQADWDLVWIDKGLSIRPRTLIHMRERLGTVPIVSFSPDDMSNPANQSQRWRDAIGIYDLHVTTKSYNVAELLEAGARAAHFMPNGYDPNVHRPVALDDEQRPRFAADVSFIGAFEGDRAALVRALVESGVPTTIHSPDWAALRDAHPQLTIHGAYLHGDDFARAIAASRINLGFLRKQNRDLQTTRSIEIPACGGFLLAERTDEHRALFREGEEAEFFEGAAELIEKCNYYLAREDERARIARAGLERCRRDGYSYAGRLAAVLARLFGPDGDAARPA